METVISEAQLWIAANVKIPTSISQLPADCLPRASVDRPLLVLDLDHTLITTVRSKPVDSRLIASSKRDSNA